MHAAFRKFGEAIARYAKAIVALATPFAIQFVIDVAPALQGSDDAVIAAIGTAIVVWLVPNLPKRSSPVNRIPADVTEV
jgi:hypothetical protein